MQSLLNHPFFTFSCLILIALFLCGIHKRVVSPSMYPFIFISVCFPKTHWFSKDNQCDGEQTTLIKSILDCNIQIPVWEQLSTDHSHLWKVVATQVSRLMGKPTICLGENKDADQLRSNREADQRLCFRYSDSSIHLLLKSEISSF